MANPDSQLTGGIMAFIVMLLVFDDDEQRPGPSLSDDDSDQGREEKHDRKQ
jgi:hypothetical protein